MARSAGRVAILCGPGGNGGDGFIAARLLAERGYRVEPFLLGAREALRGDPALAAQRYGGVAAPAEAFDPDGADLVIDALYGAGLSRDVDGLARQCVERINDFASRGGAVLGVDVPSGIDGETGAVRGVAVRASASVTFFRLKPGHLLLPGREHCGRLALADIGIDAAALTRDRAADLSQCAGDMARRLSPARGRLAQIYPRLGAGALGRGASHRGGADGGARGAARGRGPGRARQSARCGRGQFGAFDGGDDRAVRRAAGVRGAAGRFPAQRRSDRPRRRRRRRRRGRSSRRR